MHSAMVVSVQPTAIEHEMDADLEVNPALRDQPRPDPEILDVLQHPLRSEWFKREFPVVATCMKNVIVLLIFFVACSLVSLVFRSP